MAKKDPSNKLTQEEAISRMKQLEPNYNYSKFVYKNVKTKSTIICDKGHEFEVNLDHFQHGNRCPYCAEVKRRKSRTFKQEDVIKRMQELEPEYDFSKFVYTKSIDKSIIICPKGHEYMNSYNTFVNGGHRCHKCSNNKSKPEYEIIEFIKTFYNGTIEHSNKSIIKNHKTGNYLELDIYLPELNKAIEFNGKYYHTEERMKERGWNSVDEYHIMKTIYCKAKGIDLLHIFEDKWVENKDNILNRIKEHIL